MVCSSLLAGVILSAIIFGSFEGVPGLSRVLSAQLAFGDFLVFLSPKPRLPFDSALVGIDSSSLNLDQIDPADIAASRGLRLMKEGYPWSREVYALACERLAQAGARLVLLDVFLRDPRKGDEFFRQVLEKYPDRFVLVSNFIEDLAGPGQNIVRYELPAPDVLPPGGGNIGFANFWRDFDGTVRVAPFRLRQPGTHEKALSASAVMLRLLADERHIETLPDEAPFIPGIEATHSTLAPIPLWELFDKKSWSENLQNGAVFRNKIVVIGAHTSDAHDEFRTPVERTVPGIALHLSVLAAAWQGAFYSMPSQIVSAVSCFLAALIALGVSLAFRGVAVRALLFVTGVVIMIGSGIAALFFLHTLIPLLPILGGFLCGGVATLLVDLIAEGHARLRARRTLERYVSPDVVREILDTPSSFLQALGGVRRDVTIAFTDLRGFSSFAESSEPGELLIQLNDYLGRMTSVIFSSGGGVDKFIGDGIMAVWGALGSREPQVEAVSAVLCAQKMLVELDEINSDRLANGLPEWHIGIGIHSGPIVFGNVGSLQKMEPTVIGDTVNLASRTESLSKTYKLSLLITDAARELSALDISLFRSVDRIRVVGREQSVDLFTIWNVDVPGEERRQYEEAVALYRKGEFTRAANIFQNLLQASPSDPLYLLYAARCHKMMETPPPGDWDGITQATSK